MNIGYLKENIKMACSIPYAFYLWATYKQSRRVVINYHSVKSWQVDKFEKQMAYLSERCLVIKPSEIMNQYGKNSERKVAITFDDAFTSVVDNCLPVLRRYGFAAGIFVPVKYLGQVPCWSSGRDCPDTDEIVMDEQQIVEIDREGYEIFSHTVSHPVLTNISDEALETELVDSKKTLERIIGHQILGISYPHGDYDERVCKAVQKAGYQIGFTIEPSLIDSSTNNLRIGRISVSPDDSLAKFKLKISGAYGVTKYLKTIKRIVMRKLNNRD